MFKKIWHLSTTYRLYNFVKTSYDYYKAKKFVGETFYSDAFHKVINKYLGVNLKKDWLGRLYGVANPNIKDGKWDVSTMIIEVDGENTNTNEGVKQWAFKQLQLIASLFKIEKMYDYISLHKETLNIQYTKLQKLMEHQQYRHFLRLLFHY